MSEERHWSGESTMRKQAPPLTEADVRRIVREELEAATRSAPWPRGSRPFANDEVSELPRPHGRPSPPS